MAGRYGEVQPELSGVAKSLTIGEALREARQRLGISTRDLERATGVANAQISKVESGARPDPSFRTVTRLAKGIGVSLDDLLARVEGREAGAPDGAAVARATALAKLARARADHAKAGQSIEDAVRALSQPKPVRRRSK